MGDHILLRRIYHGTACNDAAQIAVSVVSLAVRRLLEIYVVEPACRGSLVIMSLNDSML